MSEVSSDALSLGLERSVTRNARLLTSTQALAIIPSQINSLIASLVVLKLTGSAALAGLVIGVTFAGRIVVPYFSGWLMDKKGRRLVLVIGAALLGLSYFALALVQISPNLVAFLILFLVYGIGYAMVTQIRVAITDMYDVQKAGSAVAYLYTASVIGSIATIPIVFLADSLANAWGLNEYVMLWLAGAISMIPAIAVVSLVNPDPRVIAKAMNPASREMVRSRRRVELSQLVGPFTASSISWGVMVAMMALLSLDMNSYGFALFLIQATITIHVIGMYLPSYILGRFIDAHGTKLLMILGSLITGIGGLLTVSAANYYTITLGMFLVGVGWCAATLSSTAAIVALTDLSVRGRLFGLNDVANNVASVILPLVGGTIIGAYGFLSLGTFALAVSVPAAVVSLLRTSGQKLPGM